MLFYTNLISTIFLIFTITKIKYFNTRNIFLTILYTSTTITCCFKLYIENISIKIVP